MSTDTTTDNSWTRPELEARYPFESAVRGIDDKLVPVTRDEYDAWIEFSLGQPKPPAHLPPDLPDA